MIGFTGWFWPIRFDGWLWPIRFDVSFKAVGSFEAILSMKLWLKMSELISQNHLVYQSNSFYNLMQMFTLQKLYHDRWHLCCRSIFPWLSQTMTVPAVRCPCQGQRQGTMILFCPRPLWLRRQMAPYPKMTSPTRGASGLYPTITAMKVARSCCIQLNNIMFTFLSEISSYICWKICV